MILAFSVFTDYYFLFPFLPFLLLFLGLLQEIYLTTSISNQELEAFNLFSIMTQSIKVEYCKANGLNSLWSKCL